MKPLNIDEAADFLNIASETLRRKAQAGEIPAGKPGKRWVFIEEDLVKYIRSLYHGESIVYALDETINEGKACQFINDTVKNIQKNTRGGLVSRYQTEKEYEYQLKHLIGKKHRDSMTN